MVRTTVYLPADLVALAKAHALNMGNTLTGFVREGLEDKLKVKTKLKKEFVLKTYKLGMGKFDRSMAYDLT